MLELLIIFAVAFVIAWIIVPFAVISIKGKVGRIEDDISDLKRILIYQTELLEKIAGVENAEEPEAVQEARAAANKSNSFEYNPVEIKEAQDLDALLSAIERKKQQ